MKAKKPTFEYRKLATMLGYLARDMQHHRHARVSIPRAWRGVMDGDFDRFRVEDVEEAALEAERMARDV